MISTRPSKPITPLSTCSISWKIKLCSGISVSQVTCHTAETLFLDMLVQSTHDRNWNTEKNYRWLDSRVDEQERQMTIKAKPISLLLPDFKEKSYVLNIIDTPGHPNFHWRSSSGAADKWRSSAGGRRNRRRDDDDIARDQAHRTGRPERGGGDKQNRPADRGDEDTAGRCLSKNKAHAGGNQWAIRQIYCAVWNEQPVCYLTCAQ